KRSDGQLHGVLNMMEEGKDCADIVTQLSAVRSSIDRAISLIVAENLVECVQDNIKNGSTGEESVEQAIQLLMKSR
ncbi:metal-sensitive transcriptional regulator, partial [Ruoffia sp. FAM 26255]